MTNISWLWESLRGRLPSPLLGIALTMRLARVRMYDLLAEVADVPDVVSLAREHCEKLPAA
jgi:hypothetical protein